MKGQNGLIAAVIIFFIGLFTYTKLAGPIPFLVNNYNTNKSDLFQAEGQGSVSQVPDLVTISFGVTKSSSTVSDAQNQTNKAINSIKNTNRLIDAITGNGGNLIGQVQFGFDDKTKAKLENKARKEAVGNAKEKAQNLANAAGVRLGKIINVTESQDNFPRPIPFESAKAGIQETPTTNITPGENSIKISVTLTYESY